MDTTSLFNSLGLPDKASDIYLAALELGQCSASALARKAGVQRTYFYELAEPLLARGILLATPEGKRRQFTAADPERLVALAKEQYQEFRELLPELKARQNTQGAKPRVFFYAGSEGVDEINQDTLRYRGEIVGFTTPRFAKANRGRLAKEYIKKRVELKNKVRVIGPQSTELERLKELDWKEWRETRLLPKELFNSNVEIGVYGNKVFIIDYKSNHGLIIESSEVSKTLKQVFGIVWEVTKR